ncbi:MAG: hypothetical protein WCG91_02305 [Candidatus Shapirobacteria bacterium]
MRENSSGQSLIELIFAVGVVVMVITGIVILMVNTINSKSRGFDQKKAVELSNVVMEDLISTKRNDPEKFWKLTNISGATDPNFIGFKYDVGFTNRTDVECEGGYCADAIVTVTNSGGQTNVSQRFFSRSGN